MSYALREAPGCGEGLGRVACRRRRNALAIMKLAVSRRFRHGPTNKDPVAAPSSSKAWAALVLLMMLLGAEISRGAVRQNGTRRLLVSSKFNSLANLHFAVDCQVRQRGICRRLNV